MSFARLRERLWEADLAKRKKKRRSPLAALLNALLTLTDFLCESVAAASVALLHGALALVRLALRGLLLLMKLLARAAAWPFVRLHRFLVGRGNRARQCLRLDGPEFEAYVAQVLGDNGFRRIELTKGSGDQGVDILAERNGKAYAIQCKNYAGSVGNFAVQEAYAGAQFYGCEEAAVICPGEFTRGAKELAASTGVHLWDGKRLSHMMKISGRRPHHRA